LVVVRATDAHGPGEQEAADAADRELLQGIRNDDAQALDRLLRTHADGLTRYAAMIVGRTDVAQDVVQDVFIKLWDVRHDLTIAGSVGGYLLRMTRNRALNVARHERSLNRLARIASRDASLVRVDVYNAGEAELDAQELTRVIQLGIDALPPRTRDVFLMRRQSGMSATAVAEALGISVASVHVQLSRALHRIAQEIGRQLG
jgi:RNA polymerase sigma-70 factor (ECF subfamily)